MFEARHLEPGRTLTSDVACEASYLPWASLVVTALGNAVVVIIWHGRYKPLAACGTDGTKQISVDPRKFAVGVFILALRAIVAVAPVFHLNTSRLFPHCQVL